MKWGLTTLVMLSPFTPESSAGSIVRFGLRFGPGAWIVKFTAELVVEPLSCVALASTLKSPSAGFWVGNVRVNDPSGALVVVTAGLNEIYVLVVVSNLSSSTVTPGSVTPMNRGSVMIVMLSPTVPVSSAGFIARVGVTGAAGL